MKLDDTLVVAALKALVYDPDATELHNQLFGVCLWSNADTRSDLPAERVHNCPDCGLVLDRDVNAAVNILHKSNLWAETVQDAPTYRDAECVASKAVCFS